MGLVRCDMTGTEGNIGAQIERVMDALKNAGKINQYHQLGTKLEDCESDLQRMALMAQYVDMKWGEKKTVVLVSGSGRRRLWEDMLQIARG